MRIGIKCNSYITISHKILQRFWIYTGFRHIAAIRVPANMRGDNSHLHFVSIIIFLNDVLKVMLPVQRITVNGEN